MQPSKKPPSPLQPIKLVDYKVKTCQREKNPCKICFQSVSKKNGLQCKGSCQNWVHYECLNYTPGRIKDIKAGTIDVSCPCPDCKTEYPKEVRTDEPYSCTSEKCPANTPPVCQNTGCPSLANANKQNQANMDKPSDAKNSWVIDCDKKSCKKNAKPISKSSGQSQEQSGDTSRGSRGASVTVVEQMCNTVEKLTKQINELMCKMKNAQEGQGNSRRPNCARSDSGELPPKPCYCPQNPNR